MYSNSRTNDSTNRFSLENQTHMSRSVCSLIPEQMTLVSQIKVLIFQVFRGKIIDLWEE